MSKSLLKSTSLVSTMTLLSRILGFIRDMLAARLFGVNATVDAFLVAFKLPNFMRTLFAEGAFSQAFVPTLAHYRLHKTHAETQQFIQYVAGALSAILLFLTLIAIIIMPFIVKLNAPGFDAYRFHLATYFCRITFGYLMLISLAALIGAILNSYGKFAIPAFTPALLNVSLIIAALYFTRFFHVPIESQAWGILIAGFLQIGFQLPYLKRLDFLSWPKISWQNEGVRKILKLMVPAIFGASIVQIGIFINTIFASFLKVGSVSWLYFAERLAYFPQGVFGVALATVTLPHLSRQFAQKSEQGFKNALDWGIRCNFLIGLPAALTMGLLAGPLVSTLFQYGHFHSYDVIMTKSSVIAYAIGLQAFMLIKMLSSAFYAQQNIATPVKIGTTAVIINILFNFLFIHSLAHAGLALATSLSACVNAGLLGYFLWRKNIYHFQAGWLRFSLQLLFANLLISVWLWWQQGPLQQWFRWTALQRLEHLSYILVSTMVIYFVALALSGLRLKHFVAAEQDNALPRH